MLLETGGKRNGMGNSGMVCQERAKNWTEKMKVIKTKINK